MDDEENALYLIAEVFESKSHTRPGEIEKFKAFLLHYDHTRAVEPWTTAEEKVTSWDDLEENVRPLLIRAREIAETLNLKVSHALSRFANSGGS